MYSLWVTYMDGDDMDDNNDNDNNNNNNNNNNHDRHPVVLHTCTLPGFILLQSMSLPRHQHHRHYRYM